MPGIQMPLQSQYFAPTNHPSFRPRSSNAMICNRPRNVSLLIQFYKSDDPTAKSENAALSALSAAVYPPDAVANWPGHSIESAPAMRMASHQPARARNILDCRCSCGTVHTVTHLEDSAALTSPNFLPGKKDGDHSDIRQFTARLPTQTTGVN